MSTQMWIGRISSSPEHHRMPGSPVQDVTFTLEDRPVLAERGKRRAAGGPLLLRCVAWRGLAQLIADTYRTGDRVIVIGSLRQRTARAATSVELEVSDIGALLHEGTPFLRAPAIHGEPD
ncbi:single-stranded DNA-binding protein [Kitasatospora sp. NBC_01246]|uniref:single-stranded DNA-binding protein n=1 Tax=Kitasatospora sp. NBC_01246 TaxID=2903570 RepID=UPI002E33570A|nr:single-stranded DNA-binding protein [Kitasatospora sp. NBC_01246]